MNSTSTEALEIFTNTPPIHLQLKLRQAQEMVRIDDKQEDGPLNTDFNAWLGSTSSAGKTPTLFGPRQANLVLIAYASSEGSGEPAHPRSLARTSAARPYKQWVKRNLQTESQIPSPSEWLGMRSLNLSCRNARRQIRLTGLISSSDVQVQANEWQNRDIFSWKGVHQGFYVFDEG